MLGVERPESMHIIFNGTHVPTEARGYYVDRSIKTLALPPVKKGANMLVIEKEYGERSALEALYILGDFGVRVTGSATVITQLPETLGFADIVHQGLPFYSGKLSYHFKVETAGGDLAVAVPRYRASVLRIGLDGKSVPVAFSPYTAHFSPAPGVHHVTVEAFIPRTNGFGPLHNCDESCSYQSPGAWRTKGDEWSYEYCFAREGLLAAPRFTEYERKTGETE